MKSMHDCPPLLVGDTVYIITYQHEIVPARVSMVTQKSDETWTFRASYKYSKNTKQICFSQNQLNEERVFLKKEYANKFLEENNHENL